MPNFQDLNLRDTALRFLLGQAQGWVARAIGLPYAAIAAVILALAWSAVQPLASAVHGGLIARTRAQAQVVESRFVCDASAARQLALIGLDHVVSGEAGCAMREQALLHFVDAKGVAHTVLASEPSDSFTPQYFTVDFSGGAFEHTFALLNPKTYVEPDAVPFLQEVRSEIPTGFALGNDSGTGSWSQLDALRARMNDPLVFTAFAWVRPSAAKSVELRYAAYDPEHAWLDAFLTNPSDWNQIPWSVVLILGPVGIIVMFFVARLFVGDWHPNAPALATVLIVLATPWWAPRLFDVMNYFAKHAETVAQVRGDFGAVLQSYDGRVEPLSDQALQGLTPDAAAGPLYTRLLDGLIPAAPETPYKDMGAAFDALCARVAERFAALPKAARDERYPIVSTLQEHGISTPGACLLPVAIKALDDAFDMRRPRPIPEYDFLMAYVYQRGVGSSFVADYSGARKLIKTAKAALSREIERRN